MRPGTWPLAEFCGVSCHILLQAFIQLGVTHAVRRAALLLFAHTFILTTWNGLFEDHLSHKPLRHHALWDNSSMAAFTVRPATRSDAPAIAAVYSQTLYDGGYSVPDVLEGMRHRQGAYFVAVAEGEVIAAGNVTYASPRSVLDSANVGMRAAQRRLLAA